MKESMSMSNQVSPGVVSAQRRSILMRIHFWSALIASPFALVAAITGLIYVFVPQIEAALYGHLDNVTPSSIVRPLDHAVDAAKKNAPEGWILHSVVPMHGPNDSTRVAFMPPATERKKDGGGHGSHGGGATPAKDKSDFLRPNFGVPMKAVVVYVNPYTAEVLGSLPQSERFSNWSRKLHSNYLQNDGWRWLIELAASWLMVMLVTGLYLWWPRTPQPFVPQAKVKGRASWMQWHTFVGVSLSVMSAVILTTGLTWSKQAGDQIRWARDAAGQASPRIPATFKSNPNDGAKVLTWEDAMQAVRREAPDVQMQLMPPKGSEGYWRANQIDRDQPDRRFDLLLDAYSGERLYFSGWADQTAFGKATAIGIPFHRGEFGVWNQALLFVFGVGVIFSIVSGWGMYFKRRRQGQSILPMVMKGAWRVVPLGAWLGGAFMLLAMPLLAISALGVMVLEGAIALNRQPNR
jgi:uncharacterized iron-regulated membrane protein